MNPGLEDRSLGNWVEERSEIGGNHKEGEILWRRVHDANHAFRWVVWSSRCSTGAAHKGHSGQERAEIEHEALLRWRYVLGRPSAADSDNRAMVRLGKYLKAVHFPGDVEVVQGRIAVK